MSILPAGVRNNEVGLGMLSEAEAGLLEQCANDRIVLEIGSYTGMSTIVIAKAAKMVVSADWHFGDAHIGAADTLQILDRNLRAHKVRDKVIFLVGNFYNTLPMLKDTQFDFVYIDGAHTYEHVKHDTEQALRLARIGAIIAWHDYDQADVKRVVDNTHKEVLAQADRLLVARIL